MVRSEIDQVNADIATLAKAIADLEETRSILVTELDPETGVPSQVTSIEREYACVLPLLIGILSNTHRYWTTNLSTDVFTSLAESLSFALAKEVTDE